ncbi:MAG TPA: hypothetical protein PK280_08660 [Planctomycetota bacterium]|nr:hypothetical protein [Planctomycetota bacterium]
MRAWLKRTIVVVAVVAAVGGALYGGMQARAWMAGSSSPDAYAISSVKAKVTAGDDCATVRLAVEMAGPGNLKESRVPVLPTGVSLIEARLDGSPARMDLIDGRPAIIMRGSGRHLAEITYALPLTAERKLSLALPRGILTSVDFELGKAGYVVQAAPPAIVEMLGGAKGTAARIVLPPSDRLELTWFPRPTEVAASARTAARTETLYTIQGDYLAGRTAYSVRIDGRDVSRLAFILPEGVSVDQVDGDCVRNWEAAAGRLVIQAPGPFSGEHRLVVHHRRTLSGAEAGMEVPALEGAVRQWGYGAVAAGGAVEIKELTVEGGMEIDPRGLPETLASAGSAAVARAFRYDALPSRQRLTLVRHPEIETLEATCDSLNLLMVRTSDGRSVVKAVYSVRNARRQHLEVKLPAAAKVWSTYVAGGPVRPSLAEGGKVLVPLSCSGATASRGFAVELVYMVPGEAFGAKGRFEAALPEVDIPVMQAMVSISVPEDIQLEDFSGSLRRVDSFALVIESRDAEQVRKAAQANPGDRDLVQAVQSFDQQVAAANAQASVRLSNESLDVNGEFQKAIRDNWNNRAYLRQYYLENSAKDAAPAGPRPESRRLNLTGFGQEELAGITGLASLSVAVPNGGRTYRFERQLLIGEGAQIRADYWSALAAAPLGDAAVRMAAKSSALYALSGRGLSLAASLQYSLDAGKVDGLVCRLPAGAKVVALHGSNVAGWEAKDGTVEVRLVRPERSGGSLSLRAELPAGASTGAEGLLAPVRLSGAASEEAVVAVSAPADFELSFPGAESVERLTPKALPAELGAAGDGRGSLSVFRLGPAAAAGVRIKAVRHAGLTALAATCDSVNAISFWTEEGAAMTRAIYEIRNVSQQHLELALPAGAKLWGAFVADRAVQPLAGEEGKVLVPLDVSADGQVRSFPVEVVYLLAGRNFERRGQFAAELPRVNVPVMHAMYSLYLPKKLRLADFTGTLKPVKDFSAPVVPPAPEVRSNAAPAETAAVAGLRREAELRNARYMGRQQALEANMDERELARLVERSATASKPAPGATKAGGGSPEPELLAGCGLKIYIPAVGQMLRFERHLVVEGKMSVGCGYRS